MIISKARENDREVRLNLLKTMKICLSRYMTTQDEAWKEKARWYGKQSAKLAERIKSHDYTEEDAMIKRVDNFHKQFTNL